MMNVQDDTIEKIEVHRHSINLAWTNFRQYQGKAYSVFTPPSQRFLYRHQFCDFLEIEHSVFADWCNGNCNYLALSKKAAARVKILAECPVDRWETLFKIVEAKYS